MRWPCYSADNSLGRGWRGKAWPEVQNVAPRAAGWEIMDSTPCLPPSSSFFPSSSSIWKAEGFPLPLAICCCHSHIISGFPLLLQLVVVLVYTTTGILEFRILVCRLHSPTPVDSFFFPPTPTIEVVTDDKQIHLSNSICARSVLCLFIFHL